MDVSSTNIEVKEEQTTNIPVKKQEILLASQGTPLNEAEYPAYLFEKNEDTSLEKNDRFDSKSRR